MNEETTNTTPGAGTTPAANQEGTKSEKTFTQAELDTIISERLTRATKDVPKKEELESFRAWKELQKSESEKAGAVDGKANKELDSAMARISSMEKHICTLSKGVPFEKADKYARLAEAYMAEGTTFEKALEKALTDFPLAGERQSVPGSGGNPPKSAEKSAAQTGTRIF